MLARGVSFATSVVTMYACLEGVVDFYNEGEVVRAQGGLLQGSASQ